MSEAKLIRKIESGKAWYFDKYEYECIDCGEHFTRGSYTRRIRPYCAECSIRHEREKARQRNKEKELQKKIALIDEAIKQAADELSGYSANEVIAFLKHFKEGLTDD